MPMIDVYAPTGLFPKGTEAKLAQELALAVLRAEGVHEPGPFHLANTAAFVHTLPPDAIATAGDAPAAVVRVQIVTPPGALDRTGQRDLTTAVTDLVARYAGQADLTGRTWVILTEAAEGGWGIAGVAYGAEEFDRLRSSAPPAH